MKKFNLKHKKIGTILLLSSALLTGVLSSAKLYEASPLAAEYPSGGVPTNIDLNDANDETIRNYYKNVEGKSNDDILINLKTILKTNQKYNSYDKNSGKNIWLAYEIADRDWEKSPASEITNGRYDPDTNTIKYYRYGSSSVSGTAQDPYVHALYVNKDKENIKTAWGAHTPRSDERCIEREHVWPKSRGFDAKTDGGARGDLMALRAADGFVNGKHSNKHYGFVDKTKPFDDLGKETGFTTTMLDGNYIGKSKTFPSYNGEVFEPQDSDKGDIARAVFYMVARYNNLSGIDEDLIDSSNPNLALADSIADLSGGTGESTATQPGYLGIMQDLLEWNILDPVDEFEIHRNNLLFNNFTKNRNPFIDFPQWADYIWGDKKGIKVSPSTDKINGLDPVIVPTDDGFKTTVYSVSDSNAKLNEMSDGAYFISAAKNDGTEVYLDSSLITKNIKPVGKEFNTNLRTGHFNLKFSETRDSVTLMTDTRSSYLAYKSGTDLSPNDKGRSWNITQDSTKVNKYGTVDNDLFLLTSVESNDRSLLFKGGEFNYFGNYVNENALNNEYTGVYFHKAIYSYDELIRLSSIMTVNDLKNEEFYKNYSAIFNSLNAKELEGLKKDSVVAQDHKTYNADELVRKAISEYNPEKPTPTNEELMMYALVGVIVLVILIIILVIFINKKHKKSARKKARKNSKRK